MVMETPNQIDPSKIEATKELEKLDTNDNSPKEVEANEDSPMGPGSQAQGDQAASVDELRSVETDGTGIKDSGSANDGDCAVAARAKEDGISRTMSSSHEHSSSRIEDGCMGEVEEHSTAQSSDHHPNVYEFTKADTGVKDYDTREKSDAEVDYDMVDPLEVARQVAIEVEREVGDRREQSCSSSDKAPENDGEHPDSQDASHETESRPQKELSEEVPLRFDLSAEDPETSPESLDTDEPKKGTLECSQLTEVAQGLPAETEKSVCVFDLNEEVSSEGEEVSSEDEDQQENPTTTPVSVVSASRAAAAPPGLPNAPLQFKGLFGWKGSAATSAFRPASPRRVPEGDKVHSTGGSNSSSTQRRDLRDIDLNMDDYIYDETPGKLVSGSGLPSGESSVEVSARVPEKVVMFDLNRLTDDSDAPSERDHHQRRNGYVGLCLSSSSSSEQQLSRMKFDLNYPSWASESPDHHPSIMKLSQKLNASPDENSIVLFGRKIGDKRDETVDVNLSGGGGGGGGGGFVGISSYTEPSIYGCSGLPRAVGLSSSYMLDSRGAAVIHQGGLRYSSGVAPADPFFHSSPFMMSVAGPLQNNNNNNNNNNNSFDLNSGGVFIDGLGSRGESVGGGGFGQFLNTVQSLPINDQLRSSGSGVVGTKRRVSDLEWDLFPPSFRHPPPPTWK